MKMFNEECEGIYVKLKAFKTALPYTLPICIGFFFIGMSYGLLMQSKDFSLIYPVVMSCFIFAGSMEFVTVNLLMTALFVVMFVDQWEKNPDHRPAIIDIVCSLICLLIFGSSSFMLPSMGLILISFMITRKNDSRKEAAK